MEPNANVWWFRNVFKLRLCSLFSTPLNSEFSLKYECPCLIDPAVNDLDLVDLLLGYDPGRSSQCSHILLQLTRRALCDSAGRAPAVCYYARLMLSRKNL